MRVQDPFSQIQSQLLFKAYYLNKLRFKDVQAVGLQLAINL